MPSRQHFTKKSGINGKPGAKLQRQRLLKYFQLCCFSWELWQWFVNCKNVYIDDFSQETCCQTLTLSTKCINMSNCVNRISDLRKAKQNCSIESPTSFRSASPLWCNIHGAIHSKNFSHFTATNDSFSHINHGLQLKPCLINFASCLVQFQVTRHSLWAFLVFKFNLTHEMKVLNEIFTCFFYQPRSG